MATALTTLYTQATAASSQQIGKIAMIQVALSVVSEAKEYTTIDTEQVEAHAIKHKKRHELAVKVLNDPDYWTTRFVFSALSLDQPGGVGTDILIIQAVTSVFDKIAGVDSGD